MVTKSIKDANQLSGKLPVILLELESRLQRSWKGDPWQLDSIETTNFSVQFNMFRSSEELVKVDLLPTFEANVGTDAGTYLNTSRLVAWHRLSLSVRGFLPKPLIIRQNFILRASPIFNKKIPHSKNCKRNGVKFSAQ